MVEGVLKLGLPAEDWNSLLERTMVKEVMGRVVLGAVVKKIVQPWFWWGVLLGSLGEKKGSAEVNLVALEASLSTMYTPLTQTTTLTYLEQPPFSLGSNIAYINPTYLALVSTAYKQPITPHDHRIIPHHRFSHPPSNPHQRVSFLIHHVQKDTQTPCGFASIRSAVRERPSPVDRAFGGSLGCRIEVDHADLGVVVARHSNHARICWA